MPDPAETSKLKRLQAQLSDRGLAPRKAFGQNFMIDSNFAAAVARDSFPGADTLTLEVGPGTGCLTRAILDAHPRARVLAIELDTGLAALLRETFSTEIEGGRLTLLEGDALDGKHALSPELVSTAQTLSANEQRPRLALCANLPYNAATPLLANLAAGAQGLFVESAVVTVQLEVAQRLFGSAGSSDYGALTAFMSLRASGAILRRVGSEVFWPRPQVDSAVIRIAFKPFTDDPATLQRAESGAFQEFLKKLFSQRRKTLRAALKPLKLPATLDISGDARAEDLQPLELLRIFRAAT